MTTFEIIQILIGSGGLLGIVIVFFRIGKSVQQLDSMEHDVKSFQADMKEVKRDLSHINIQIGKLETRVEERTMRLVQAYDREPIER